VGSQVEVRQRAREPRRGRRARHRPPDRRSRRRPSGHSALPESLAQCRASRDPRARAVEDGIGRKQRPSPPVRGCRPTGILVSTLQGEESVIREGSNRPVSANERRKGRQVWAIARRVAVPVIPLLLGAGAMALLLDSGTVHLPPIGSGSGSSSAAPAKVVVAAPATGKATPNRPNRQVAPARSVPSAPATTGSTAAAVPASSSPTSSAPQQSSPGFRQLPTPRQPPGGEGTPFAPAGPPAAARKFPPPAAPPGLALGHEKHGLAAKPPKPPKPEHHGPPNKPPKPPKFHGPTGKPPKPERHGPPGSPPGPKHHVPPGHARKEDKVKPCHSSGDKGHGPHGEGHGPHGHGHGH